MLWLNNVFLRKFHVTDILSNMKKASGPYEKKPYHLEGDVWLVPCIANYQSDFFDPLFVPETNNSTKKHALGKGWNDRDDAILLKVVLARGPRSWNLIAKEMNTLLHNGEAVKSGRQCRERWLNHVDPDLKKSKWTEEEDIYLLETQLQMGNKWSEIAKGLPGRTENSTKNRWKSMIKKALKEWSEATDIVGVLLAQKKQEVIEKNNGECILLISPLMSSRPLPELVNSRLDHDSYVPPMTEIDSVRSTLSKLAFFESMNPDPFTYQDHCLETSPSFFLA